MTPSVLLALETAGSRCSAAVLRGDAVLAAESRELRHGHAEALLPIVDRAVRAAGLRPRQLDCVAVALGPGGFTGIRVGIAAAHGIARGAGARLVGVTSFAAVAVRAAARAHGCAALLVALDSRREDLYVQLFATEGLAALAAPQAVLPHRLAGYAAAGGAGGPLLIAGDAAAAAAAALAGQADTVTAADLVPDALGVAAAARCRLGCEDRDGPVRPFYLRPPDATLPPPTAPFAAPR